MRTHHRKPFWFLTFFLYLVLWLSSHTYAQGTLTLNDTDEKYTLGLYLEFLEDHDKQWTLEQISSPEFDEQFAPGQDEIPSFGFTDSAYWLRIRLKNEATEHVLWLLELGNATMNSIDMYLAPADCQPVTGQCLIKEIHAGDRLPFSARELPHRLFLFYLPLDTTRTYTLYLRFENADMMSMPLTLRTPTGYMLQTQSLSIVLGGFYGILLIMAGYNLFLSFSLRDKSFGYYVFFIVMYLIYQAANDGLTTQYLWLDRFWLIHRAVFLFGCLTLISALLFTRSFLQVKKYVPKLYLGINILLLGLVILLPSSFFVGLRVIFSS